MSTQAPSHFLTMLTHSLRGILIKWSEAGFSQKWLETRKTSETVSINWQTFQKLTNLWRKYHFRTFRRLLRAICLYHGLLLYIQCETQKGWKTLLQNVQILVYKQVHGPDEAAQALGRWVLMTVASGRWVLMTVYSWCKFGLTAVDIRFWAGRWTASLD
jgi:hypothetical protein